MKAKKKWSWKSNQVDPKKEHLELVYDREKSFKQGDLIVVARVEQPINRVFSVQFLISGDDPSNAKALAEVRRQLDYYLVEKDETAPWEYACYHTGTSANIYSSVHWQHVAKDE